MGVLSVACFGFFVCDVHIGMPGIGLQRSSSGNDKERISFP